jgi:hypothetical protein
MTRRHLSKNLPLSLLQTGARGGISQSGSGPSADKRGNLYLTIGNSTASAQEGGEDYGNAILKLSRSGTVLDWFIPFNFEVLNAGDVDLGSTGAMFIPKTSLLIGGSKQGNLYLLDRRALGHFRSQANSQIVQTLNVGSAIYGTPTYWSGPDGPRIYVWGSGDVGKMFRLRRGRLLVTPGSSTSMTTEKPGATMSLSANGAVAGTGIIWAVTGEGSPSYQSVPGILRAFDASDLSREIYNSKQNAARDDLGLKAKFNTPIVANGKVYVATFSKQIVVYGQ